jgi:2-polyprenyl-3-methyl-5-hydroxy-6-metoxy-1,4-benzoquinol methylase
MSTLAFTPLLQGSPQETEAAPDGLDAPSLSRYTAHHKLALLARIRRRYQTAEQELTIGGLRLNFTRVADPDQVLDEVAHEADRRERLSGRREAEPLHLPYWAELWDSALGVGAFISKLRIEDGGSRIALRRDASPQSSILHPLSSIPTLDLGCGMGLTGTVAVAMGADVTFADLEAPALLFARLNSLPFDPSGWRTRTRRLNWQTDRLGRRFDLIVGADILYERDQWDFLERPPGARRLRPAG